MKYLAMSSSDLEQERALLVAEMRLTDAPVEYLRALADKPLHILRQQHAWWFEGDSNAWSTNSWREYIIARYRDSK